MGLLDTTMDLIVGPRQLELTGNVRRCAADIVLSIEVMNQHEQRCLEKRYVGVEEEMRKVKIVTSETRVPLPSETVKFANLQLEAAKAHIPPQGIRPARQLVAERYPSAGAGPLDKFIAPTGPPDITAIDLTPDQLARTYSTDHIWDTKSQPLPPLPIMRGFGIHRHAVNAPIEWQTQRLEKRNSFLPPQLIDTATTLDLGYDPAAVSLYRQSSLRSGSFASSKSSFSGYSDSLVEESICPKTGTRIQRGFIPSGPPSMASSQSSPRIRKISILSSSSIDSNGEGVFTRSKASRSLAKQITRTTRGLKIIPDFKKVEKPCEFDDDGNIESAFISDDEEESGSWESLPPSINIPPRGSGELSKLIKSVSSYADSPPLELTRELEKAGPALGLDRSNTVRLVPTKSAPRHLRQTQARNSKNAPLTNVTKGLDRTEVHKRPTARRMNPERRNVDNENVDFGDDFDELGFYIRDISGEATMLEPKLDKQITQANKDPRQTMKNEEVVGSAESDESTMIVASLAEPERRRRSATAIRIRSGNQCCN